LPWTLVPINEFGANPIEIGGVETGSGVTITHIVGYHLPYRIHGKPCKLVFGLAKGAAASAMVSITFLKALKAYWCFDPSNPAIFMSPWNISLPVTYEAPTVRDISWPQQNGDATSLMAQGTGQTLIQE